MPKLLRDPFPIEKGTHIGQSKNMFELKESTCSKICEMIGLDRPMRSRGREPSGTGTNTKEME